MALAVLYVHELLSKPGRYDLPPGFERESVPAGQVEHTGFVVRFLHGDVFTGRFSHWALNWAMRDNESDGRACPERTLDGYLLFASVPPWRPARGVPPREDLVVANLFSRCSQHQPE